MKDAWKNKLGHFLTVLMERTKGMNSLVGHCINKFSYGCKTCTLYIAITNNAVSNLCKSGHIVVIISLYM